MFKNWMDFFSDHFKLCSLCSDAALERECST